MRYGMGILLVICASAHSADVMYVQSLRAELKKEAKMSAAKVVEVRRGDVLTIESREGGWVKARHGEKSGFISRLFLSSHRPVGAAELSKDIPTSLEKATRRRASSYAVSASTRGLVLDSRARQGREMYRSDFEALEDLEGYRVPDDDLDKFGSSAKLWVE